MFEIIREQLALDDIDRLVFAGMMIILCYIGDCLCGGF